MSHLNLPSYPETRVSDLVVPRSDSVRDLSVTGEIIATASSDPHGEKDRWTELHIVHTDKGAFVGISVGRSVLPHESDIVNSAVCDSLEGLKEFFKVNGKRSGLSMVLFDKVRHLMTHPEIDRV